MSFRSCSLAVLVGSVLCFAAVPQTFAAVRATQAATGADLLVTKSGPPSAAANTDVTFDVVVTNGGPDPAMTVSLTDTVPAGMTFVSENQNNGPAFSCSNPAVGSGGTITCSLALMTAGSSADFSFVMHIPTGTPPGTTFTNIANVTSATPDPNSENNSGATAVMTSGLLQADISVTKNGPPSAPANTDVAFVIVVSNGGPDNAQTVSLSDTLPGTMTFVSMMQNGGTPFSCTTPSVGAGGTVNCSVATLVAGGNATFTLTTHIPPGTVSGTTFVNTATGNSATTDPNPDNNQGNAGVTVSSADVGVVKSGPATATAGGTITWTITASNAGPDAAQNAGWSDTLPSGTTFVSVTQNTGPPTGCNTPPVGGAGTVSCSWATLSSGASAQFTLVAAVGSNVPAGTIISNTASMSSDDADPNGANNSSTANTTVTTSTDLALTKNGPAAASTATDITYSIGLTNNGPSAAASVSLTDAVPTNTTFVSESQNTGPVFSCANPSVGGTGTITCTIASFPAGATATFTIVVHVSPAAPNGSTITNTANVSSSTTDTNPGNNSANAMTLVTPGVVDVSITKSAPPPPYGTGATISYLITVANAGPSSANSVVMTDILPAGTTFVSATPSQGSCSGTTTVTCSLGTLASGASATVTLKVTLPSATGPVSNTATVSSANADSNPANNTSTSTITVIPAASIPLASPLVLLLLAITLGVAGLFVKRL